MLASFREHEGAVSAWFTVLALSAALLAPVAIGVGRLSAAASDADRRAGRDRGGGRAGHRPAALADPRARLRVRRAERPDRADAATRSRTASDILGTAIGETLGYLLTAAWTVLVIVALGRRFAGRWFAGARRASPRRSSSSASSRRSTCPVVDTANFLGYVLWSVWLIAFGVVILVRERRQRRDEPAAVAS